MRQELRICIALARNPVFKDDEEKLDENGNPRIKNQDKLNQMIQNAQLKIIGRCKALYKYIDYLHDRRKDVPLKFKENQPP